MILLIFAMLLVLGEVSLLVSYTLVGGAMQIGHSSALVDLGITRIRQYRVDLPFRL